MLKNSLHFILKKEIIAPIIVLLVCISLCFISKKIIHRIFNTKTLKLKDGKKKSIINLISNIIIVLIFVIGILIILEVYGIAPTSLMASLGVVGIVIGLALQDLLKDFIVGISIVFEGQFSIGDWVQINGFKGEVLPSNLRTTKLKAITGEIKIIYNRNITEIINYSLVKATLIIDVGVSYDSDIEKVKAILDELCLKLKKTYNLEKISCLGIQELAENSIKYRLTTQISYEEQFDLDREIKKEIVLEFEKNNITIPYNQVVVHNGKGI